MIARITALASLLVLPALAGCRDYNKDNRDRTATGTATNQDRSGATPSETRAPTSPATTEYGQNTTGQGATAPSRTTETPSQDTPNLQFPGATAQPGATAMQGTVGSTADESNTIANVSLTGDANGSAVFFTDAKGDIRATINVRGAKAGSYGAYLFADASCDEVKRLEKPFAKEGSTTTGATSDTRADTTKDTSKPGTTGKNANETDHWTSLGTVSVGSASAPATSTIDIDLERSDLDRHVVTIFEISGAADAKPKMVSCGEVKMSEAPEAQG